MASKFLNISTDTTLGGSSPADDVVSSQKAIKSYVDSQTGQAPAFANIVGQPTDNANLASALNAKQDVISNLATIESGAAAGATAVQPGDLATVATTGDYDDLLNKPTIPTVNNATLTIQKNGTTVNTFTANASSDVTVNITVPTKISDLTNDSNFANTDLSNLTSTGKNLGNWSTNVTNCITDIPQDINLTLSNGTLTLKAGSKVYVPNGFEADGTTPHFDVITIANDVSGTISFNGTCTVVYRPSNNIISFYSSTVDSSGSTDPSGTATFYNTTQNIMKRFDGSSLTTSGFSFPIARVVTTTSGVQSIVAVSNGFGYIGSTVFALPGVKGLIPDGRNADGTLKNTIFTTSSVITKTFSSNNSGDYAAFLNDSAFGAFTYSYDEANNRNIYNFAYIGTIHITSGVVNKFNTKPAFHAVDYSDWNEHRVMAFQAPTSANGYKGYRKYSDGSIDQWGFINNATWSSYQYTVTLPVAMRDALYASVAVPYGNPTDDDYITNIQTQDTTTLKIRLRSGQKSCSWIVHGMAA